MKTENNRLIVVLGMHRSGTSAITRGLQVTGVDLGDKLLPSIEGNNSKGFWEDWEIVNFNIDILASLRSTWCSVSPFTKNQLDELKMEGYFLRAVELLREKVGNSPIFAFKDPRVAKLLPFWKEVFSHCNFDVDYVLAIRHPLSVTKSIIKRDDLEAEQSYLLWLGYVITSLSYSASERRVLVDYDRLMQSPDRELNRIAKYLELEIDPAELQSYKAEFLDEELRHTVYELNDLALDLSCPPIVREVYTALLEVASDHIRLDELESKFTRWSDEFERLKSPLMLIDKLFAQKVVANQSVAERDEGVVALTQALTERDGQMSSLNQILSERDSQMASFNQTLNERDSQIANLQALNERDGQVLNLIYDSTSWRLTSPIRFLGLQWLRFRHILKLLPSAIKQGNGLKFTIIKAFKIYRNEGLVGIRRALLTLPATVASSPPPIRLTNLKKQPEIPKINFDQSSNGYGEYKKNPAISSSVKLIAFYLPQFHPFPENDEWWGKGFTEWTNVGKAKPNYKGHYQPHCPIHHGYYDLRIPEVMEEQAKLAKEYGIYGFSYYFYWFGGKILMDTPLELMLANKKVDIPFCFTWANENWSRRWDGQEHDILIAQDHSNEDSLSFIQHLVKYFKDERYIKIDGKPVLIIYRADIIPEIAATAKIWRDELLKYDIPGLYLISAQSFSIRSPEPFNFDASVEFPPHTIISSEINNEIELLNKNYSGRIYSYEQVVKNAVLSSEPDYKLYRTAMLSWDNTARKQNNSHIFHGFSLLLYKQWLSSIVNKVYSNPKYNTDEKIVFVNAWNEWAEGTHLEPDQKFGYGYLQTTYDVLENYDFQPKNLTVKPHNIVKKSDYAVIAHVHYEELWPNISEYLLNSFNKNEFDFYVSVTSLAIARKVLEDFPDANIELVENRGRDILPFINMLKAIQGLGYVAVCKIHSKRSIYRNDGDEIRNEIYSALMGSKEQVATILSKFRNNPKLGMVAAQNYLIKHNDHNMTFDKEGVSKISKLLKVDFKYDIFPAGSMFWFAPNSLAPLLSINDNMFEIESGLADGTNAHAVERMFCVLVKNQNYEIESC